MLIVRPVETNDLDALEGLAGLTGVGLTTLPPDKKFLRRRIKSSLASFDSLREDADSPAGEAYLFVMEDLKDRRLVGVCGIFSKTGGYEPFYSYKIETEHFKSAVPGIAIDKKVDVLKLHEDHNGPSEIGSLFLHPDYRQSGNGRFLQLVRFLFVAEHAARFEERIITEIRGVSDADGNSPFWAAVGQHFFGIDFPRADYLSVVNKKFIAELMPDHPIYVPMLPQSAREVIGVPHKASEPAVRNLIEEGFQKSDAVDIFDAGPCYECRRDSIRTVRESRIASIAGIAVGELASEPFMLSTRAKDRPFRACVTSLLTEPPDRIRVPEIVLESLNVETGDELRYCPLRPARRGT
jgi:arginine N-succinyltransferase